MPPRNHHGNLTFVDQLSTEFQIYDLVERGIVAYVEEWPFPGSVLVPEALHAGQASISVSSTEKWSSHSKPLTLVALPQ